MTKGDNQSHNRQSENNSYAPSKSGCVTGKQGAKSLQLNKDASAIAKRYFSEARLEIRMALLFDNWASSFNSE